MKHAVVGNFMHIPQHVPKMWELTEWTLEGYFSKER